MTTEDPINLEIEVQATDATDADIFDMAGNLYAEIKDSQVESVDRVRLESAPAGTKMGDPVTLAALAVAVLPTAIPSLIALVQAWVMRGQGRTVKFKYGGIEYEGSREDLEKLLEKIEKGKGKKKK